MALVLKRITDPYFCCHCDTTRKMLVYMDYYYEDDEDGMIVDYNYYYDRKLAMQREKAMGEDHFKKGMDQLSYQAYMFEAERKMFERDLFERPLQSQLEREKINAK